MSITRRYAGVVLDLDGVVYVGEEVVPGAGEAVDALRGSGVGVVFATNNAVREPAQVAASLTAMGVAASADEVVTSAMAAADLLEPATRCLRIGADGLRAALRDRGCVEVERPTDAEAVVVGLDTAVVYDDLRRATLALAAGARFIGTNADVALPTPEGLWPGNGAVLAALTAATGREPQIAGKPEPPLFQAAAARLPAGPLLMVGDRPDTDLAGAAALGWDTALVLTGVTAPDDVANVRPQPTYVARSLPDLLADQRIRRS